METKEIDIVKTDALFERISALIEESRKKVATTVNVAEVYTKYEIGRYIVEDEQEGNYKAAYGKKVLISLSQKLSNRFGKGWTVESLTLTRKFYLEYSNSVNTVYEMSGVPITKDNSKIVNTVYEIQNAPAAPHKFVLSWSHYLVLMRIEDENARSFYEIECAKQNWSVRWLQRQAVTSYIEKGEAEGCNLKHLTKNRTPWYALEKREPAPIWVSVFSRDRLHFVRNTSFATCLTTFHCVYPRNDVFGGVPIDLLFAYLISDTARKIFLDNGREYGNGLSKFEPNDLNKGMMLGLRLLSADDRDRMIESYHKIEAGDNSAIDIIDNILTAAFAA